jgi:Uma2 family endonuclease
MEGTLIGVQAAEERPTTANWELADLILRSPDASWDRTRWERLPADGNRYEVIDGVLYMTTAPSSFHQWISRQIFLMLVRQVDDAGVGLSFYAPTGVFMPGCDPVQPDLLVIPSGAMEIVRERRVFGVPALIVEILSPSNADQDTDTKRAAYARCALPEYWIVRPAERDVLVLSHPDTALGEYLQSAHVPPEGELQSPTLPIRTPIAGFFAGAPDTTL